MGHYKKVPVKGPVIGVNADFIGMVTLVECCYTSQYWMCLWYGYYWNKDNIYVHVNFKM